LCRLDHCYIVTLCCVAFALCAPSGVEESESPRASPAALVLPRPGPFVGVTVFLLPAESSGPVSTLVTPLESALTKNASASPLGSALARSLDLNPPGIILLQETRGVPLHPASLLQPFCSAAYSQRRRPLAMRRTPRYLRLTRPPRASACGCNPVMRRAN